MHAVQRDYRKILINLSIWEQVRSLVDAKRLEDVVRRLEKGIVAYLAEPSSQTETQLSESTQAASKEGQMFLENVMPPGIQVLIKLTPDPNPTSLLIFLASSKKLKLPSVVVVGITRRPTDDETSWYVDLGNFPPVTEQLPPLATPVNDVTYIGFKTGFALPAEQKSKAMILLCRDIAGRTGRLLIFEEHSQKPALESGTWYQMNY